MKIYKTVIPAYLFCGLMGWIVSISSGQETGKGTVKPIVRDIDRKRQTDVFTDAFREALRAQDQAKMEELVRQAGQETVYKAVISMSKRDIQWHAEGKVGVSFLNTVEIIAATYAGVFKKEGLLKQVRAYKQHSPAMCKENLRGDDLLDQGADLYAKGESKGALKLWAGALEIFELLNDWDGQSRVLNNMGTVYDQFGQHVEALNFYQQALTITRMLNNRPLEATVLMNTGQVYRDLLAYESFLNFNLEAVALSREIGEKEKEAEGMRNAARAYEELERFDDAVRYFKQALSVAMDLNHMEKAAKILNDIGLVHDKTGRFESALQYHLEALEASRKIENPTEEAYALGNAGNAYMKLLRYKEALIYLQKAMEKFQQVGDTDAEIIANQNSALCLLNMGLNEDALEVYEEVLRKVRKSKNVAREAETLERLGTVYQRLGEYQRALDHYSDAIKIYKQIDAKDRYGGVLMEIGTLHENTGRYAAALDYYREALEFSKSAQKISYEATVLGNMGILYNKLGQYGKALDYLMRSLEKSAKDDIHGKAVLFLSIANVYENLGDYSKTIGYYDQSLQQYLQLKDADGASAALGNKANIQKNLGQYEKALANYGLVLETNRKTGRSASAATTLNNLGSLHNKLFNYPKARELFQESLQISERINEFETLWRANIGLGQVCWESGDPESAVPHYQKAIATIEEIYANTQGLKEEERSSMIGEKSSVYREFIELLLELHRKFPSKGYDKQAFSIAEKGKSRTFQELMAKAGAKIALSGDETFKKMVEKEQQLIREITKLQGTLTKEMSKPEKQRSEDTVKSLKEQLSKAEKSLNDLEKEIDAKYPRYADLKRPKPLSVEDLQEVLEPGETVIAYAVGREKVIAFVIAKERFKMLELETKPEELTQLIKGFRKGLENVHEMKDLEEFKPETAYALYQKLMAPLAAELKGITKLYIAADNILYTLPFEALVDQEVDKERFREARQQGKKGGKAYLGEYAVLHYLVDTYTIAYLPSASMLRSLRKYEKPGYGKWTKPLIAFADPVFSEKEGIEGASQGMKGKGVSAETELTLQILTRSTGGDEKTLPRLKESAEEAAAIGKEVKGKPEDMYLREKATEENVYKTKLQEARYLLFSTHGLLGGDFSGVAEPALALTLINNPPGKDGFLGMSEVLGLDLNAELIILSACNTSGQRDKTGAGEGFMGLTRSFMYAGTRSILVTHWSVESQAARDLMVGTFKTMQKETRPKALRQSKLKMKSSTRDDKGVPGTKLSLAHPFFWAPFVLVGEGE